jgi:hypothetical protein
MKTEVYSWRVSVDLKTELEREARRRKISLSAVLDTAAKEWLEKQTPGKDEAARQIKLQRAAATCFGAFAGGNKCRSETVRESTRARLRRKYEG